jgi:hypothetical protein
VQSYRPTLACSSASPSPSGSTGTAHQIVHAFRAYPQFRGLSIDDLDAFMAARN